MGASLEGKAIIVTGAGRGLGAAYARLAARCGASIVVNDVDAAAVDEVVAGICADGGTACTGVADVSTWDGSAALIKSCIDAYGQVDGLVNNAGVQSRGFPWEIDPVRLSGWCGSMSWAPSMPARMPSPRCARRVMDRLST